MQHPRLRFFFSLYRYQTFSLTSLILLTLAERAYPGFQELRQFLKVKDKTIKLSGYGDVDQYDLGQVLSLDDFEGRSSWKTWVFGIALRVVRTYRRTQQRKGNVDPLPPDLADPSGASPMEEAAKGEAVRILDRLLDELDDDKRVVFVLTELEQMTAKEIAEALAINVNTVYSRLRAARSAFERSVERHHAREKRRER